MENAEALEILQKPFWNRENDEFSWKPYRRVPGAVWAMRMNVDFECRTLSGTVAGKSGDWLVRSENGEEYPMPDALFRRQYTER